jgi:hypothetical protein
MFGCGSGSSPTPSISLSAGTEPIGVATPREFTATIHNYPGGQVVWEVVESDGGTVSQSGVYTAPAKPGIYHVAASLAQDPSVRATATITVQSGGLIGTIDFPSTGDLPVTIR